MRRADRCRSTPTGFTLIELLVTVGLIFLLAGLTLPSLAAARESARRITCVNHLKQLGIALESYQQTQGCLPPGRMKSYDPRFSAWNAPCSSRWIDKGLMIDILPYVEQVNAYNAINQNLSILGPENQTLHTFSIAVYACPDDPSAGHPRDTPAEILQPFDLPDPPGGRRQMVSTSYAGSVGPYLTNALPSVANGCHPSAKALNQNQGVFCDASPISHGSVSDGLSQTVFMTEKSTETMKSLNVVNPRSYELHGWYVTGNWGDTLISSLYKPNAFKDVALRATGAVTYSASSLHQGGANVLMGDGAVRFLLDSIDSWPFDPSSGLPLGIEKSPEGLWINTPRLGVWQALTTRSGGEMVQDTWD